MTPSDPRAARAMAVLEAHGATRQQMSEALGISISTVARIKREDGYQEMVAKAAEAQVDRLKPYIDQVSLDVIGGLQKGIAKLIDLLDVSDSEGHPLYGIQQTAAEKLLDAGIKFVTPSALTARHPEDTQGRGPQASITFNIDTKQGAVSVVDGEAIPDEDHELPAGDDAEDLGPSDYS